MNDVDLLHEDLTPKQLKRIEKLNENGATLNKTLKAVAEGLVAEKIIYDKYGDEIARDPDHNARAKFVELSLRAHGFIVDEKVGLNVLNMDGALSQMILKATRDALNGSARRAPIET